ncbi:MAG TPA: hypothetical protein O0X32_00510 [Methanocorpusculum sp.]|nr:hypothetical protein [Methanocorpusculum sp.]
MTVEEQSRVLHELQQADGRVKKAIRYITPKNGIILACAKTDAKDQTGIAVSCNGSIGFGVDETVSRVLITVRRFNQDICAVGCICLNDVIAETVKEIFIDVGEYDVEKFPKGISTMEWGVSFLCKTGVPMAICAKNELKEGGYIYIFGETPNDVVNRILIISERLKI